MIEFSYAPMPDESRYPGGIPEGEARSPGLVLVVEDHEETRLVLQDMLEACGFRVAAEANGADGLRAIEELSPDLVITDLVMPVLSGAEMARAITAPDGSRERPVILVTSHVADMDGDPADEAPFDAIVSKPVQPSMLLDIIYRLLGRR